MSLDSLTYSQGGNRGLGNAISRDIAKAGGNIAMLSRSEASEAANALAKEFGVKAKSYQCDVGVEQKVDETFAHSDESERCDEMLRDLALISSRFFTSPFFSHFVLFVFDVDHRSASSTSLASTNGACRSIDGV